jgi:hypothetical protein
MSGVGHPTLVLDTLLFSSTNLCPSGATLPNSSGGRLATNERGSMDDYPGLDPYSRFKYDQGIDSKIVVMGNSGEVHIKYFPCNLYVHTRPLGVGKTSLLHRYTQNKFDPKNTTSTSGAFFVTKKVYVNGVKVRLQLWDTAGQERFRSMVSLLSVLPSILPRTQLTLFFFRRRCIIEVNAYPSLYAALQLPRQMYSSSSFCTGANAALLLYDITNVSTFEDIRGWLQG